MCGIVGLHLRDPKLYPQLGPLLEAMIIQMSERGPDSAGVAVYGDPRVCPEGQTVVSVLAHGAPAPGIRASLPDIPELHITEPGATPVLAPPLSTRRARGSPAPPRWAAPL